MTISALEWSSRDLLQIRRATLPPLSSRASTDAFEQSFHSLAGRVGNKPETFSRLGCADIRGPHSIPLRIIPEGGKRPENAVKSAPGEAVNVFDLDDLRADFGDDALVFEPEPGAVTVETGVDAVDMRGDADVLAGEASADGVHSNSIGSQSGPGEGANIIVAGDLWPMASQHTAAERVDLAERDGSKSARPFQTQIEAADASEKGKRPEHHSPLATSRAMPIDGQTRISLSPR